MTEALIGESWYNKLKDEFDKPYFVELKSKLREAYTTTKVYPAPNQIFQAFKETPFEEVRVVMLGQDPYPFSDRSGNPHAHGIALSSQSIETPASLRAMFKELDRDILKTETYQEFKEALPTNDLTQWCKQGVLLLNTCLTVQAGHVGSHSTFGWQSFINRVLVELLLSGINRRMVFIVLGKEAEKQLNLALSEAVTYYGDEDQLPLILRTGHPATGAHGKDLFSGCNIYSKTNHYFWKNNLKEIEWKLNQEKSLKKIG